MRTDGRFIFVCLVLSAAVWAFPAWGQEASPAEAPAEPRAVVESRGDDAGGHEEEGHVPDVHWAWMLPFVLLLGSIASMPLINYRFWEHHYPWFAVGLGAITAVYYLFIFDDPAAPSAWLHEMQEYVSFIALLGSLYVVSGGIVIHVSRRATPMTNTMLLMIGAVIANVFGTTGAAMLLIRPYLRINRAHIKPYHIVFFIFIVANCGGCLTPIGDPPLFMGYLKGVPFSWVAEALWPMWAVCVGLLLGGFFILDTLDHRRAERTPHAHDAGRAVEIFGFQNFVFIGLILVAVFRPSVFEVFREGRYAGLLLSREVLMVAAGAASKLTTRPYTYERNEFSWAPIREVAILFLGIFSTMVPALNYLNTHSDKMPLHTPGQYYYVTGALSAVLDNAPTYLVFLEAKQGQVQHAYGETLGALRRHLDEHPPGVVPPPPPPDSDPHLLGAYETLVRDKRQEVAGGRISDADIRIAMLISGKDMEIFLVAISIGSVFFGAFTYIGNGPNFMVKSIAEASGVKMPGFFGYVMHYALPVLLPVYVLIWVVFFVWRP